MPSKITKTNYNILRQQGYDDTLIFELSSDAVSSYIKKYNEMKTKGKNPQPFAEKQSNVDKKPFISSNKIKSNKKPTKIVNIFNIDHKGQKVAKGPKNVQYFLNILITNYKKARKMDLKDYLIRCYNFCLNNIKRPLTRWQQFVKENFKSVANEVKTTKFSVVLPILSKLYNSAK